MLGCEDRLNTVAPMIWWSTWESAFHDKLKFAIEKLRVVQLCRCLRSFAVFSQLLKLHMLYVYIYIYICIYQLLVLFVFFTPVFKCTGISYPPVLGLLFDHFRSRFSTSSAPLLLADSEELILWDRNLVVSPTGWKHKARSKRISTFNIPTYQLVQRGYFLFIKLNMSGFTAFFFHSNSWNLVCQSWQFKACQREWYGKLASLWLAEPGPAQDVLPQSEQVLILSWIYDICTFEKVVKMWSSLGFDMIRYKFYKHKPPQLPNVPAKSGWCWEGPEIARRAFTSKQMECSCLERRGRRKVSRFHVTREAPQVTSIFWGFLDLKTSKNIEKPLPPTNSGQ